MSKQYFSLWVRMHIGPQIDPQPKGDREYSGLCVRIGEHAWIWGRHDFRDKTCPWPVWARVRLVLGFRGQWKLYAFGHPNFRRLMTKHDDAASHMKRWEQPLIYGHKNEGNLYKDRDANRKKGAT